MDETAGARNKGKRTFTWADPPGWVDVARGIRLAPLTFFGQGGPAGPEMVIVDYPPDVVVPVHFHRSDYCSIVVSGSIQVNRTWHGAGTIRIVKGGTAYGLRAGPDGCRLIEVFERADGDEAVPVNPDDAEEFAQSQRSTEAAVRELAARAAR